MKRLLICLLLFPLFTQAQQLYHKDILGKATLKDFQQEPHAAWYNKNYQDYQAQASVVSALKQLNLSGVKVKIVFGSWCGDSKREVPRMTKLLSECSFPEKNVELIGVDDSLTVYKQSPTREEKGLGIYRVPTFVFYKKDKEIGRIVEYPTESLERDLLALLKEESYTPNYFSYPYIAKWMAEGMLTDTNVSPRGLAQQLLGKVQYESELNSCGYVLLADKKSAEAITVFRINTSLFPQSANCFDSLGEAYSVAGLTDKAIQSYEQALRLKPDSENAKEQLKKLKGE
jgi:tetratricopeptide (TPR) repeat protein